MTRRWNRTRWPSRAAISNGCSRPGTSRLAGRIGDLPVDLNTARKAAACGDVDLPDLNAEDVAAVIERYVDAVGGLPA